MGDRAHAVVKSGTSKVYLYTHWDATELPEIIRAALRRVPGRWEDAPYLTRAIFCQMVQADWAKETGYGIHGEPCEDTSRDILVDVDSQIVSGRGESATFADYAKASA